MEPARTRTAKGYIDDRALEVRTEDRFHLGALADELADLIVTQRTPLNIAVFGPWGSGKSSLAVFLQQGLSSKSESTRFVRIDAWKYSKDSFRRQFIMESARTLGLDVEDYRKKLYQKNTHSELSIPWEALGRLAGLLAAFLAVVFGLALLFGIVIALIAVTADKKTQFVPSLYAFLRGVAPSAVLSASVLAALFAFMGKLFVTDVTQSEVSSDEHFERVFKDLVKEANKATLSEKIPGRGAVKKIVFYIDELDRCASKDVVAVLEGIRTFLEVKDCVFVVSADNRVLELAVQQESPHPVPDEESNPYYSSGAEYLDKLFQHQLTIPALLPHRLTSFALGLVDGAGGVWGIAAERGDLGNLVSVLVPSHVRSPRRVKVLLNGFVSLYEVAKSRHLDDPQGAPDPTVRMLELAKLSTLRLEFPLFYRDLIRFPRLATHLTAFELNLHDWPDGVEAEARAYGDDDLVKKYAHLERAADTMLGVATPGDDAPPEEPGQDDPAVVGDGSSEQARRGELLAYLRKTANVAGPSRDIVFLEGAGSPYSISADLADLVERDAINNDIEPLTARVQDLPMDQRIGVLHFLHETRRLMVGVEATNALSAAVHLVTHIELDGLAAVADELVSDLALESTNKPLPVEWLPAAVSIGLAALSAEGHALAADTLADRRLREEGFDSTALAALDAGGDALTGAASATSDLLVEMPSGFIATALVDGQVSNNLMSHIISNTAMLDSLAARWKGGADEEDVDDLGELSKCLRSTDESLDWRLAARLAKTGRVDLIDAWLAASPTIPQTAQDTATLIGLAAASSRERWQPLEPSFEEAPASSSVALYTMARRLFNDIDSAPDDEAHSALVGILRRCWGNPAWPSNWSSKEPFDWVITPSWSEGDVRARKFMLTRDMARLDVKPEAFWVPALVRDYTDLVESGASPETIESVGDSIQADWSLFDAETQMALSDSIQTGGGLPDDLKRLWAARLSVVSNEPFPFELDLVPTLTSGTDNDRAAVKLWLEHHSSPDEVLAFIAVDDLAVEPYLNEIAAGLDRFEAPEATRIAETVVAANLAVEPAQYGRLLSGVVPVEFAVWLAEALRNATNEPERARLLGVWATWSPEHGEARRPLTDAYLHVAGSGRGGFELALKNISLVRNPPRGTKGLIVNTLAERSALYGLEKKTGSALLSAGLVKKVRKGLFGKTTLVPDPDE